MALHKRTQSLSAPDVESSPAIEREEGLYSLPPVDNPAIALQRRLLREFGLGTTSGEIMPPPPSRLRLPLEQAISISSRIAGPLLFTFAVMGLIKAVL